MTVPGRAATSNPASGPVTRRWLFRAGPAAAGAALLAGACTPGQGGGFAIGVRPTVGPATITFMHWWAPPAGFGVAMEQALAAWAAKATPIKVESQIIPAGETIGKYTNMLAAGTPPEVVFVQPFNFAPLHVRGAWVDLSGLIRRDEREVKLADFYPEPLVRVTRDGKLHGLPTDINVTILLYNKSLLDAAGVRAPTDDLTWEQLLEAARPLSRGEGAERQWGLHFPTDWEPVVWANGGEVLNKDENLSRLDEPAAYEAVQWLADLRHRHRVAPLPAELSQQGGDVALFLASRIAFWPAQSGALSNVKGRTPSFVWGVAQPPRGRVARKGYLRGANIAIMNGSRHVEASWQFVKHMSSPEVHTLWANPGALMPPRKSVADSGAFIQPPPPLDMRKAVDAIAAARTPHFIPEWVEMNEIINQTLGALWRTGERSARETCLEAKRQLDTLLAPRRR